MVNKDIISLRHKLHKHPEVSNDERHTSTLIKSFILNYQPDEVVELGRNGLAFVFKGKHEGKTLMFRAELDALPINENSSLDYSSVNNNISHACGHDGHMAILAGLAQTIAENRPTKGRVILLFQPAEEIGQGAEEIVNNPEFIRIEPDYIFALHNIPGVELHKVLIKRGSFASASKGMTIKLFGKTSHAAEPENGISPVNAIALIIEALNKLIENKSIFSGLTLLTIVHIIAGEIAFGTSPGYAEIRITLRAYENEDMELLTKKVETSIDEISKAERLRTEISYCDVFPATINNADCVRIIETSAKENNLEIVHIVQPFKWSEDFGFYTEKYKGALFGLGAGIDHAQLHNPDYNFPDEIIETGINTF